jgi:hypothetical protein
MKRFLVATFAAVLVSAWPSAAAAGTPYVFSTVDAVERTGNGLKITGILEGEAAPTGVWFYFSSSLPTFDATCERLALLTMSKPGMYVLSVTQISNSYALCKIARAVP